MLCALQNYHKAQALHAPLAAARQCARLVYYCLSHAAIPDHVPGLSLRNKLRRVRSVSVSEVSAALMTVLWLAGRLDNTSPSWPQAMRRTGRDALPWHCYSVHFCMMRPNATFNQGRSSTRNQECETLYWYQFIYDLFIDITPGIRDDEQRL